MSDFLLFLLVFAAVAAGWGVGRLAQRRGSRGEPRDETGEHYYRGLNFFLNEQPDAAVDAFINSLEVNTDTLETHLAVGALLRRRGEVDRAIRIHQNLLARPSLPLHYLHQVHLELARDYISAGLLDRAERLLQDLLNQAPSMRSTAMKHLQEIYQDEKEWEKAIAVASELVPRRPWLRAPGHQNDAVTRAVSHYYCELAHRALADNDYPLARSSLSHALNHDRNCVRASILLAQLENDSGNPRRALKVLRRVFQQDPAYLPEIIDLLRDTYHDLGTEGEFVGHLMGWYREFPGTTSLLALVDAIRESNGEQQAEAFLADELKRRPTLRGFAKLIEFNRSDNRPPAIESYQVLEQLIERLLREKPAYQCKKCGFSGQKLHWMCPSCKEWGSIAPIRGPEGD